MCLQPHRHARHIIGTPTQINSGVEGASRSTDGGISGVVWSVENTTACSKNSSGEQDVLIVMLRDRESENDHVHELLWRPSFQVICVHVHIIGIPTQLPRNCIHLGRFSNRCNLPRLSAALKTPASAQVSA